MWVKARLWTVLGQRKWQVKKKIQHKSKVKTQNCHQLLLSLQSIFTQPLLRLYACSNWNIVLNSLTEGIFIRCHHVLNKCGLWCSLISACSTCSVWALFAGSVPQRLLKEPLHLCQGQVEICCTLLIGQSAFQTLSHHTQIRLSYRPGVNRGFSPPSSPPALFSIF